MRHQFAHILRGLWNRGISLEDKREVRYSTPSAISSSGIQKIETVNVPLAHLENKPLRKFKHQVYDKSLFNAKLFSTPG